MIVYHASEFELIEARAHPWSVGLNDKSNVYFDFKAYPNLIRTSLEDFKQYENHAFCQTFYELLEWLNGENSFFETNDCAFKSPSENIDKQFKYTKRCSGRLMILYRDIYENTQFKSIDWLFNNLMKLLYVRDREFRAGAIGLSIMKTIYKALSPNPNEGGSGWQIMLSFFAYADNKNISFKNMNRILFNVSKCLFSLNNRIKQGEVKALNSY